jgi:dTDP-4-amino-4,6-dideoxy-D-galactose acyltransferase
MSLPSFELLPWDSDLFGYPVARLNPEVLAPGRTPEALRTLRQEGVRLAYGIVPWEAAIARGELEALGAPMVDHKVRFRKTIQVDPGFPEGVDRWETPECPMEMEALALASGHLSRFRVDPKVPPHVFPTLYLTWIRRSVAGEIAQAVLVTRDGEALTGLTTLALDGRRAEIGLMVIDGKHRGQRLGSRLMKAAEAWAVAQGAEVIEVVTQGTNVGACALYRAAGFHLAVEQAVYHVWTESHP